MRALFLGRAEKMQQPLNRHVEGEGREEHVHASPRIAQQNRATDGKPHDGGDQGREHLRIQDGSIVAPLPTSLRSVSIRCIMGAADCQAASAAWLERSPGRAAAGGLAGRVRRTGCARSDA